MIGRLNNKLILIEMSLTNISITFTDVVECFNNITTQAMRSLFGNIEDFKFAYQSSIINQEKRGHLSTSSPLTFITNQSEHLEQENSEPINASNLVMDVAKIMNELLSRAKLKNINKVVHKIKTFTENFGVICLFLSDQNLIDSIFDSFNQLESIDEEDHEDLDYNNQVKIDIEKVKYHNETDSDSEDDIESETDPHPEIADYPTIGKVESIFREINGIPSQQWFSSEIQSRLLIHCSGEAPIIHNICDWKYILVEHYFRNKGVENWINLEKNSDNECFDVSKHSTWTLAHVNCIKDSIIYISGAIIQHGSDILSLKQVDSNYVIEINNKNIRLDSFYDQISG